MEAVGRYGDAALDKLFEQGPNRARAIRADVGDEVEGGIGHGVSLSAHGSDPKAEAVYTRPRAGPSAWSEETRSRRVTSEIVVSDYDPDRKSVVQGKRVDLG